MREIAKRLPFGEMISLGLSAFASSSLTNAGEFVISFAIISEVLSYDTHLYATNTFQFILVARVISFDSFLRSSYG